MINVVLTILGGFTAIFTYILGKDFLKGKKELSKTSWSKFLGVGFTVNFFDALGIGAFAPTTALFKLFKLVPDKLIPGTLNVGGTIPVVLEAFIFITVIKVEPLTLISMIVSASLGAVLGASIVSKLPEKKIQLGMGVALLIVAFVIFSRQIGWFPSGGDAVGLNGLKLIIAVVTNFILGALMTIGIGSYGPCMALVYALGMSPRVAFPIMMGSCAFLMPSASMKFIKEEAHDRKASMACSIAGVAGVLIATYIVKELPLKMLTWLVFVVILYTSIKMLKSYGDSRNLIIDTKTIVNNK